MNPPTIFIFIENIHNSKILHYQIIYHKKITELLCENYLLIAASFSVNMRYADDISLSA